MKEMASELKKLKSEISQKKEKQKALFAKKQSQIDAVKDVEKQLLETEFELKEIENDKDIRSQDAKLHQML